MEGIQRGGSVSKLGICLLTGIRYGKGMQSVWSEVLSVFIEIALRSDRIKMNPRLAWSRILSLSAKRRRKRSAPGV